MDDKKNQAKKMYEDGFQYKQIAANLDISINTLKSWKKRNKWQRGGATPEVQPSSRGAPAGNDNAKGNKGGAPPPGNKNAVKTGEHETIFYEYLTDEEKDIYSSLSDDPFFVMTEEVRLLQIRQRRMMKRIADAEAGLTEKEQERLFELRGRKTLIESKKSGKQLQVEVPDLVLTEMKEHSFRKINDILSIEDALTRVSAQLQRAVKQLNDLTVNSKRLNLMDAQIDHTKAQTTKALINKDGDETDGGTVINIIDDIG